VRGSVQGRCEYTTDLEIEVDPYDTCCCLLLQNLIQSCARGGRRIVEDMCYEIMRYNEPRLVWTSLTTTH
jgi:hypothetical protein